MDQKQKEKLRVLLEARKRADKVLAERREAERKKQDHRERLAANQELMKQYAQALTALAQQSGVLALAEQAAQQRGGRLKKEVGYYIDYGFSSSNLQRALVASEEGKDQGKLKASHLGLRIIWDEAGEAKEAEVRMHRSGQITFHNLLLPVFPFLWRAFPRLLERMMESALKHPRPAGPRNVPKERAR